MTIDTSVKLTYDDYVNLPNDGKRYEVIDGELYMNPAPNMQHQRVVGKLYRILAEFVEKHRLGEVFIAPCDVVLSEIDVVEPDLLFVSAARKAMVTRLNVQGAPDLVIEVLSQGTRNYDETIKKKRYERFGVSEYWIIDVEAESVRVLRVGRKRFQEVLVGADVTTPLLPGFSLAVADVFAV